MKRNRRLIETVLVGNARVKICGLTRTVAGHRYLTCGVYDHTGGDTCAASPTTRRPGRKPDGSPADSPMVML